MLQNTALQIITHAGEPGKEVGGVAGNSEELSELNETVDEMVDSSEFEPELVEFIEAR